MKYLETFLKWFLQIGCMSGDLMLIAAGCVGGYVVITTPVIPLKIIIALLMLGAYRTWKDQGGFMAWRKADRKNFSEGYDKIMKEGRNG